jgi:hypothetical protein
MVAAICLSLVSGENYRTQEFYTQIRRPNGVFNLAAGGLVNSFLRLKKMPKYKQGMVLTLGVGIAGAGLSYHLAKETPTININGPVSFNFTHSGAGLEKFGNVSDVVKKPSTRAQAELYHLWSNPKCLEVQTTTTHYTDHEGISRIEKGVKCTSWKK